MSTRKPLQRVQAQFFAALVGADQASTDACAEQLLDSPRLGARARLHVYQRSYILRLQSCLAEQFPALRHAVGPELFADFAREYLRECPSQSHSLYDLGNRFPDWLEHDRPDRDEPPEAREVWVDFMVDLARYEHALFRLYDAPGHEGHPWPSLAIDDAALTLQPCFALVASRFEVAAYYHAVRDGRDPPLPPQRPSYVAIARKDYLTSSFPITAVHFELLRLMQGGASVTEALARIADARGRSLEEVWRSWTTQVRGPWIRAGFFVARRA
ncbi:HvfC/BufC N-terminal domain-containing protein [Paraliomyxa miuraensis]|uniref:HvfC/BufC N-terminal domain-containing protein n=1 Tax=Paraliomyxa miuraensis TaxID=376150 RepID=UPI00224E58C8|nr:DNA-binding domain-containing protein [Paraliomyxa miuraensis]MCX4240468.1 DNA-binding domain-containing protein [Paraliomyxa miuraensis]